MASKHRERKAIAAVACPDCGAAIDTLCRRPIERKRYEHGRLVPETVYVPLVQYGRPMICAGRRVAWQMIRDKEIR